MKAIRLFPVIWFVLGWCVAPAVFAQQNKTQSVRTRINSPEEELAGFKVPEGFIVELVASERDSIVNPIDLTFDDAGRLWTQTARMYPLDPVADIKWNDLLRLMDDPEAQKNHPAFKRILDLYQGKTKGTDKILVLSDLYGSAPVKTTTWAEGLTIPMSILPYRDGAYVAQGSELFFLSDTDQDGKADRRTPLLTGFGFTDTHTMVHTLVRGPGHWVHFSQGALNKGEVSSLISGARLKLDYSKIARFSLDAKKLELVSAGLNNIWGFQLRGTGQWYGSEANDLGYSVVPLEPGSAFPGIGNERLRSYQPWVPQLHTFRVGGTGISGTAFADDAAGSFPDEYKNVAFLANPITSTINAVHIVRNSDGSVTARHLPDLLTSEDDWFRPVNMEFGPDGSLYIADWYNKIVSHNELPTTHPDRDKRHGRIWRIRHSSQKPRTVPNLYTVRTEELVEHLKSPSLWEKRAAWHQITDRPVSETQKLGDQLVLLASDDSQDEITRIHALWSMEGIRQYDPPFMASLLESPLHDLRREAVRSLTSFSLSPAELADRLRELIEDPDPAVRAQVLRTLTEAGGADGATIDLLVRASKPELLGHAMGGSYERKFERYLARKALEQYPDQLQKYLEAPLAGDIPVVNILWAIQALPAEAKEKAFLKFWPQARLNSLDEPTFVSVAGMLGNKEIVKMVKPLLENPARAVAYTTFAVQNQSQVQSAELAELLEVPVRTLLKSTAPSEVKLALDAAGRFRMDKVRDAVVPLVHDQTSDPILKLALRALENNPDANQGVFAGVVQNKKISFDLRAAALNSLAKADPLAGQRVLQTWIADLTATQKNELATLLSGTSQGAGLLMTLHEKKQMELSAFDVGAAERLVTSSRNDRRAEAIREAVKKREEEKKKAFRGQLRHYKAIAEKNTGNAGKGKVLFQTCLMCHQAGNQGQSIAPALDGSASRETEALLTAILDPDAAVESGYAVYRITKKDGSTVEGYLVSKDSRGTTLAFIGGTKVFVEAATIRSQGFLAGRSFMVKGLLDNYNDQQVADLLSYIRTLK
ncbi:PVC-type heme-binding CxxCH protein [Telluribacter sp.]|uniref:PVC-type heme-binding CxxCH protein n=1 Tax=Telluribacter sp. TaxID=1978767 RepID=UPI002E148DCF